MENAEHKTDVRGRKAPSLADLAAKPLRRSGQTIKAGTYPALFTGFGEPFWYQETFQGRRPVEKLGMRLYYIIRMPNGECERVSERVNLGKGDPLAVNIKSTLYKRLRAYAGDNEAVIRTDGTFGEGVTLESFIMKPLILGLKVNVSKKNPDREFVNVENASAAMEGLKYPSKEEADALAASVLDEEEEAEGEDIPF
jgi:hypothetical protein